MPPRSIPSVRLLGVALLAAGVCAPAAAHARASQPSCPGADTPAVSATAGEAKQAVICLVNWQRTIRALPALGEDRRLDRSAQAWSDSMVANGNLTHGADFAARITAVGFTWSTAGENIATGYRTPREVVDGWMASAGHCQNILNPAYSRIGVGLVTRPVAGNAPGAATWTQDFARPAGTPAPSQNARPMDGCPYGAGS